MFPGIMGTQSRETHVIMENRGTAEARKGLTGSQQQPCISIVVYFCQAKTELEVCNPQGELRDGLEKKEKKIMGSD